MLLKIFDKLQKIDFVLLFYFFFLFVFLISFKNLWESEHKIKGINHKKDFKKQGILKNK